MTPNDNEDAFRGFPDDLDPESPEFDEWIGKFLEHPTRSLPSQPPRVFEMAADPALSLEEFQTGVSDHLRLEFEGGNLILPAARSGKKERVEWLVDQGLDPHRVDRNGYNAVLNAIYATSPSGRDLIRYLARIGCDLNQTSKYGESPLIVLIYRGEYPLALELMTMGADPERVHFTPLHQAAAAGDLIEIRALVQSHDLEARDRWEQTPWLTAMAANQVEAATLLAELGADTGARGRRGTTSAELCARANAVDSLKSLLADDVSPDSLQKFLNHQNHFGDTLLHEAVSSDSLEIAEVLLEKGASLEIKNSVGEKPVNDASTLPMFQLLHRFGADLNHVDGCGEWPLKSTVEANDPAAVRWLLDQGVEVDQTSTGETALHSAAQGGSLAIIKLLLEAGADVNAQDVDMDSVLFSCDTAEVARFLIAAGADPSLRNQVGKTAAQSSYVSREVRDYLRTLS